MSGIHTTIAEAVKDALNGASLSQSFTATRVYVPELELRDTEDAVVVRVCPAPEGRLFSPSDRSRTRQQYPVHVAVLKKCDVDDNDVVDAYAGLLEEIQAFFSIGSRLASYTSAACIASEQVALFTWETMRQNRQYTGVLKLTFLRIA